MDLDLSSKADQAATTAQLALVDALCKANSRLKRPESNLLAVSRWLDSVLERSESEQPAILRYEWQGPTDGYQGEIFSESNC